MRFYESVFIARQDITTAQVETMADEFAEIITSAGGSIKKREYWGLRALAYRIKKNRKGHYIMLNMETGPEALGEYERILGPKRRCAAVFEYSNRRGSTRAHQS